MDDASTNWNQKTRLTEAFVFSGADLAAALWASSTSGTPAIFYPHRPKRKQGARLICGDIETVPTRRIGTKTLPQKGLANLSAMTGQRLWAPIFGLGRIPPCICRLLKHSLSRQKKSPRARVFDTKRQAGLDRQAIRGHPKCGGAAPPTRRSKLFFPRMNPEQLPVTRRAGQGHR